MFILVKMKIVKPSPNKQWLFREFVGTGKVLMGRIVKFEDGTYGNHQIQHPKFTNWFDIPKDLIEII